MYPLETKLDIENYLINIKNNKLCSK